MNIFIGHEFEVHREVDIYLIDGIGIERIFFNSFDFS